MLQEVTFKYIFLLILLEIQANSGFVNVEIRNFQCTAVDEKFVEFPECIMKPISRDNVGINVYARLLKLPLRNLTVRVRIHKRKNKNLPALVKYEIDPCIFFAAKRRNPIAELFYNLIGFDKYSNMNHTCPYNHDLIIKNGRLDRSLFKYIPLGTGEYALISDWLAEGIVRAIISFHFLTVQ